MGDHARYQAFVRRILRAYGRRMAEADPEDLVELLAMRDEVDAAIAAAARGLHASGRSWTEIGAAVGMSRQAARQRWSDNGELSADSVADRD